MFKKQQVFAMYLVNLNQKVLYHNKVICDLEVVSKWDDTCDIVNPDGNFLDCCNISDCQLILKPISEMSDTTEIIEHDLLTGQIIYESRKLAVNYEDFQKAINEHQEWLILNGYALSDEYFKLGYAIKERDVK